MADKLNLELQDDYEMSDSEEEYTAREKKLLSKVKKGRRQNESSEDEEVMKFDEDEYDEENLDGYDDNEEDSEPEKFEADSDIEDGTEKKSNRLPDGSSWGNKKHMYYNTDFHDKDYGMYNEKEEEVALMEEQEALAIQKRLASELTEADFSLETFTLAPDQQQEEEKVKKVKTDLSGMTKNQKLRLLRQDSPEFEGLVKDFSDRMTECKDLLVPTLELLKSIDFPNHPFLDFIECRKNLILNYCTNISFYLMLKAKRVKIANHPVVKRLVQFRELICKLDDIFEYVIKPQLELILAEAANDNDESDDEQIVKTSKLRMLEELKLKVESKIQESDSEVDEKQVVKPLFNKSESDDDSDENDENDDKEEPIEAQIGIEGKAGKRQITRQIAKNKGLTATKRRELRNPRVKNRNKFTKAVKRRKGAVQPIRSKSELYGGEATGIKTHLKRSVRIK